MIIFHTKVPLVWAKTATCWSRATVCLGEGGVDAVPEGGGDLRRQLQDAALGWKKNSELFSRP